MWVRSVLVCVLAKYFVGKDVTLLNIADRLLFFFKVNTRGGLMEMNAALVSELLLHLNVAFFRIITLPSIQTVQLVSRQLYYILKSFRRRYVSLCHTTLLGKAQLQAICNVLLGKLCLHNEFHVAFFLSVATCALVVLQCCVQGISYLF